MKIKTNKGLKVTIIAVVLLLCLALAIGITGAFYQAKRQATGTLSMDQGIIIDYKGFGKTPDEGIWSRENKTTFLLFGETNAQPGQNIPVNPAGIRANEKSVNFYARVKLSYKFYNGETPVEFADATKLIKTSSSFWANSWVDGGSSDGYYYYATGSTLNKFAKTSTTFVNLFATDAKFVIEGAGFTGADNNGESGGFKIDDTTSINKIEVYLTLETLQGDATAEQAKALGWKISQKVDFSKVDEGKIVTSVNGDPVDEKLNVTIKGNQTKLEEVKFPYGEETVLEFDSKNVEYVELTYSDNTTEKFYELEASENSATKYSQIQVLADESHGTVKGYTVGVFGKSEYTGFLFVKETIDFSDGAMQYITVGDNELVVGAYLGEVENLTIPSTVKIRERDLNVVIENNDRDRFALRLDSIMGSFQYPCTMTWTTINHEKKNKVLNNIIEAAELSQEINGMSNEEFNNQYTGSILFSYSAFCLTASPFVTPKSVTHIGAFSMSNHESLKIVTIAESITFIGQNAFTCDGGVLDTVIIQGNNLKKICYGAFSFSKIKTINIPESVNFIEAGWLTSQSLTMKVSDLSGTWVYAEDGSQIINGSYIAVKKGDVVDSSILLNSLQVSIEKQTT